MGVRRKTTAEANEARQALDLALRGWRGLQAQQPKTGWVRAVREAVEMTGGQLARRAGMSVSNITMLEKSEARGAIQLATLRKLAKALDCEVVYALVPNDSLERFVSARKEETGRSHLRKLRPRLNAKEFAALSKAYAKTLKGKRLWN